MSLSDAAMTDAALRGRRGLAMGHYALLTVACLFFFLPGFSALPVTDRDEARFAQASHQMLETGDFIHVVFQKEPRNKKPVGIYWLQAASAALFGGKTDRRIWMYRVPSLVGGILAVLATARLGALLFSPAVGLTAGLMLMSCLLLGVEARLATTDAMLLATIVAAQGLLAEIYLAAGEGRRSGRGTALLMWLCVGAGVLIKGPVVLIVLGGTVAYLVAVERAWRWLRDLRPVLGLAIGLAIVVPWLAAVGIETSAAFFKASLVQDFLAKIFSGQESHGAPPGAYLVSFWPSFMPFSLLAALAVPWAFARRARPAVRFCIAWIVPTWIAFALAATKLPHYLLPVFPAIAVLSAAAWLGGFEGGGLRFRKAARVVGGAGVIVCGVILAALFAGGPILLDGAVNAAGVVLAVLSLGLPVYALLWLGGVVRHRFAPVAGLIAGAWLFNAVLFQIFLPSLDTLWLSARAVDAFEHHRPCKGSRLESAGYAEPSLVFLNGTDTVLGDGQGAADHLLNDPACGVALVTDRALPAFRARLAAAGRRLVALAAIDGVNYAKLRRVRMRLYRLDR